MKARVLKIHKKDNVLVALSNLKKGEVIEHNGESYTLVDDVNAKHKFFIGDMKAGDAVYMYGVLVGKVQFDVPRGGRMTTDNTKHATGTYDYRGVKYEWHAPDVSKFKNRTFNGYHRSDGRVGTANYWLFIPMVFCENRNMDVIREALHNELGYAVTEKYKSYTRSLVDAHRSGKDLEQVQIDQLQPSPVEQRLFKNIDGIKFLNHQGGCGGTRQDAATLGRVLAAYADHPNVGGVTLLSLGCQNLQVQDFLKYLKEERNPGFDKPLYIFEQQRSQSEEQLVAEAIRKTFTGLIELNKTERKPAPLSDLCIGVKCGGSDGFSGISANPAVGYCADLVVALGGKILLAEFPELCGAEQELIDRSDEATARKFMRLMKSYEEMAHLVGSGFDMNPSPGNIKDGLITDAIKSTGAAKKGGTSPVADVLDYTEKVSKPGLSLVCTPGNDVEATTGKTASGSTLILFTTGLGTPTGNPVCPTIKLSTNTALAKRMGDIIDIDTGPIIEGEKTIEEMGETILEYCIKAASGEVIPKAVQLNQDDFIPWKRGVSL
ncbi:MAG: altronate dehydratase family protein [Chitinophagaceae bacterium]|nr:altronate dehydratase family protein [Chitinophagaceae bacterium]